MKRQIIISLVLLTGCGGGGGSGGRSDAEICSAYCDFACAKTVNCLGATTNDAAICSGSCVNAFHGDFDGDSCNAAGDAVAQMSCRELFTFLGLRREARSLGSNGSKLSEVERLISGQ